MGEGRMQEQADMLCVLGDMNRKVGKKAERWEQNVGAESKQK